MSTHSNLDAFEKEVGSIRLTYTDLCGMLNAQTGACPDGKARAQEGFKKVALSNIQECAKKLGIPQSHLDAVTL